MKGAARHIALTAAGVLVAGLVMAYARDVGVISTAHSGFDS